MPPNPPIPHAKKKPQPGGSGDLNLGKPPALPPSGSKQAKFLTWAKKQGYDRKTAADIWYWSHKYGASVGGGETFSYYWAAVLKAESGGHHVNPKTGKIESSGQAVGIGQIANSWSGSKIPWDKAGRKFTLDDNPATGLLNYAVNIRMSAYLLSTAVSDYGYDGAYTKGYNPNDPNRGKAQQKITQTLHTAPPDLIYTPSGGAGPKIANPGDTASPVFKNPYVTGIDKNGKFTTTFDPNKAMQYDGAPLTRQDFLTLRDQLTSHYISYTGKRPSNSQIAQFIVKGWNPYTLDVILSKSKHFVNSPIFKQYNANFGAAVKDLLPNKGKVPVELLRQAVVNNWDANALAAKIRQLPGYTKSQEFKGNVATLLNVHDSIMGNARPEDLHTIQEAALAGWTADQYAAYLRHQPTYQHSTEYQSKALGFLDSLGLITGGRPVMAKGVGPGPGSVQVGTQGAIPNDKRVKGNPNTLTNPLDIGATLLG